MSRKNKTGLLLLTILLALFILFFYLRKSSPEAHGLSYQTYPTENGWGYRIFAADTVLLIQQDVIPGLPGSQGFETEAKAAKTANHVISKIERGLFPPTVSPRELDSLEVL